MNRPAVSPITDHPDPQILNVLSYFRRLAYTLIYCTAGTVLIAWIIPSIGHLLPIGWSHMKANTAVMILVSAGSIGLSYPSRSVRQRALSRLLGVLVFLFAGVTFLQFFGIHLFDIDTILVPDHHSAAPGRLAFQVAFGFTMLGVVLPLLSTRAASMRRLVDGAILLLCVFLFSFIGSLFFGVEGSPGWALSNQLAPQSFFCIALLIALVIERRTSAGLFSILVASGIGGKTARFAAVPAIVLPFLIAALRDLMTHFDFLTLNYAIAIAPAITSVIALCLVLALARRNRDLEAAVHELSLRDELTGLYNRRGFIALGRQSMNLANRDKERVSALFIDVDNLKRVNDDLGHDAGSELLKEMARLLQRTFRATDVIGRIGGDEFVVVAKADGMMMTHTLSRLEALVERENKKLGRQYEIAFSSGITTTISPSETLEDLVDRADARMYEAKRERRHRATA